MTAPPPSAAAAAARLEKAGDLPAALAAYEAALALRPDDPDLLAAVARLAGRMDMPEQAARLWTLALTLRPADPEAADGAARALAHLGRFEEAIEALKSALQVHAADARLWTRLGVTLTQQGRAAEALTFLDEAVRLDPRSCAALYNRGSARFDLADLEGAAADFALARRAARRPADTVMVEFASATLALARGDLAAGWDAYEVRLSPHWERAVSFDAPGRPWAPKANLAGRRLLVVAEQGLADEIMFANVLPSVLQALGPDGRLDLAVDPRLAALFARSFPGARVLPHATAADGPRRRRAVPDLPERARVELWAPMASLTRRFRTALEDFPAEAGWLKPDPALIARWRAWLGAGPPAVGLNWRSGKASGDRRRLYPPAGAWEPVLRTPGVRFVNLQYGSEPAELDAFRQASGADILEAPGLDIRDDLEGLAALAAALDGLATVENATAALAGACGCRLLTLSGPAPWRALGTDRLPWFAGSRLFVAPAYGDWAPAMRQAAAALAALPARAPAS
jgi:tetratricopeptide (TPR) repeat protein